MKQTPASEPEITNRAGLWIRLMAFIFDGFLVSIISLPAIFISIKIERPEVFYLILFLMFAAYRIISECSNSQATMGKKIFGLKVVSADGSPIKKSQIIGANLLPIIYIFCQGILTFDEHYQLPEGMILCVAFLQILSLLFGLSIVFNKEKRGWHNLLTNTKVIKMNAKRVAHD